MIDPAKLPPVYFLRHGETAWNQERRLQGQRDIALNATGLEQARRMAAKLRQVVPVLEGYKLTASPLGRARQTMDAVLAVYGLTAKAVSVEPRLAELSFGEAEGKQWADIHAMGIEPEVRPEQYHDWRPAGGESYADGRERVLAWLESLEAPTIAVAHGGISRIVRGIVFDLPKGEIVRLRVPQDRFFRIQDGGIDWFDARGLDG